MPCATADNFRNGKLCSERLTKAVVAILMVVGLPRICTGQSDKIDSVFDHVLAVRHFSEVTISPDGRHVVWIESSVKNDTQYEHTVFVEDLQSAAPPRRVGPGDPRAEHGMATVTWSPDSKEFAYVVQATSPEQSELKVASADGSQTRSLATLKAVVNTPRWSNDGRMVAALYSEIDNPSVTAPVTSIGKSYQHQRLAVVDVISGNVRLISSPDLYVFEYDWSPNSREMAITAAPCCTEANGEGGDNWWTAELYRLDIVSGRAVSILKPKLQVASPKWSPDGTRIAFIGGLMSDFIAPGGDLFIIASEGGEPRNVTPGIKASVTCLAWIKPEEILTTEIVDGESAISIVRADKATHETLWKGAEGPNIGGLVFGLSVAKDGRTSAAARESFNRAPEVWAGPVGQWRQVSSANQDARTAIGKVASIHWISDGMQVQGWLVYPETFSPDHKYPLVVSVHGGPAAAALLHWPAPFDNLGVLSSLGYFVLYPNPRGSMGQGESFTQSNVKELGYSDFRDIKAGVMYTIENMPIDSHRVGITGWSYGGYMAMWAITQTDMFHASVAGPGVADWQSYYGQTDVEKWVIPYFGSSAYNDPPLYARSSPILFVRNAKTPTLFYVGKDDSICPAPQSFELWRALRHLDVPTELLLYSSEGHGISQPANQRDVLKQTWKWFEEYLK